MHTSPTAPGRNDHYSVYDGDKSYGQSTSLPGHRTSLERREDAIILDANIARLNRTVMPKRFQGIGALVVFNVGAMALWISVHFNIYGACVNGGRAGAFYTFLASGLSHFAVTHALSDMAARAPASGGQYHWTSEFAPSKHQHQLSFLCGWLGSLYWAALQGGTAYIGASVVFACVSVISPEREIQTIWITLLTVAFAATAQATVLGFRRLIAKMQWVVLVVTAGAFLSVIIALGVIAPKASASDVFLSFENNGGWPTLGTATLLGVNAWTPTYIGTDATAHLAEETETASKRTPKAMYIGYLLSYLTGLGSLLLILFCIQDVEEQVLNSTSAFPFIAIYARSLDNRAAAVGLASLSIILMFQCCCLALISGSREIASFASDNGLPYSQTLAKLTPQSASPINAQLVMFPVSIVFALFALGGPPALSSSAGLLTSSAYGTYLVSIWSMVYSLLTDRDLPPNYYATWTNGGHGKKIHTAICVYAAICSLFIFVLSLFPIYSELSASNFNWASVAIVTVLTASVIDYQLRGRKTYVSPVTRVRKDLDNVELSHVQGGVPKVVVE